MSSQREAILGRLDPEAAALLLEVASRPSSLLLSAERVALEDPLGRSPGVLTPQTPGLSRAERQLLSVHRRHLGLLLHELAAGLIWEADRFQDLLLGAHGPRGDERPAAPATVLAHLQAPLPPALDALNLPPHGHSLTARIGSLLQGLTDPTATATETLLRTSSSLANLLLPSPVSMLRTASSLMQAGQPRAARDLLRGLSEADLSTTAQIAHWNALCGSSAMACGDWKDALAPLSLAVEQSPSRFAAIALIASSIAERDWKQVENAFDNLLRLCQGPDSGKTPEELVARGGDLIRYFHPESGALPALLAAASGAPAGLRSRLTPLLFNWVP